MAVKPALGALNMGSMNYAKYNGKKKGFVFEFVFPNPFSEIVQIVRAMNEVETRPELEWAMWETRFRSSIWAC